MFDLSDSRRLLVAAVACMLLAGAPAGAQTTATLLGRIVDPLGAAIPGARITLEQPLSGLRFTANTGDEGTFRVSNVPPQQYVLTVESDGFEPLVRHVELRSNVPRELELRLAIGGQTATVTVTAAEAPLVDREATGTRAAVGLEAIRRIPATIGSRGVEAVLVSFPGFAQNANGAIHPRGAHNQMTFVVDGLAIGEQLTGAFANALDTGIVQAVELVTGNVPAEFGSKISAVAVVTTRSGFGLRRRLGGEVQFGLAEANTTQLAAHAGGETGRVGYFTSVNLMRTDRFLDQVSRDNLHNAGGFVRGYGRIDLLPSARDVLRVHAMGGGSAFELANLRSQQARGQDQRQRLADVSVWGAHLHSGGGSATLETLTAFRATEARLVPSVQDTPVTAAQRRTARTVTVGSRYSRSGARHAVRAGADVQYFPVRERFSFAITDPGFNDPAASGFNEVLVAHDLTRDGAPFVFDEAKAGHLLSAFVQDRVAWPRVTVSAGVRLDHYRLLVHGRAVQPRVGLAWSIASGTVLRASYNRNYQTPPHENLLLSSSEAAARLAPASVRRVLGEAHAPIRPERQHVVEIGVQQAIGRHASLDVAAYVKRSKDQQDNNNFFDTGIIFPTSLAAIDARGLEARLDLPAIRRMSGSLSVSMARAVSTPPFTGGLFLGQDAVDLLSAGPFRIDHDQALAVHGRVSYTAPSSWWVSGSVRYDSGLVANPSDPREVAADPDYADLLPYVNLAADPPRVRPRTIVDALAGTQVGTGERAWQLETQITNLTGAVALYNFQSVFVGTRLVAPRTISVRVKYRW